MLAILYDIHGNRPALEAVLEDARSLGADRWLLGGDYSAFGAWPVECVELLRSLGDDAVWIRGNWERWQVEEDAVPDAAGIQGAATAVRAGPDRGARRPADLRGHRRHALRPRLAGLRRRGVRTGGQRGRRPAVGGCR